MDASGKPRMSRRLVQRLMAHQPRTQAAFGNTGRNRRVSDRNCDRQRIGNYQSSALGARGYVPPASADNATEDYDATSDVLLSNRTFVANPLRQVEPSSTQSPPSGVPLTGPANNGINRPAQPSARFQEPPARGYNPFS